MPFGKADGGQEAMQYAVIRLGGKQYKISKDSILEVDKLVGEANSSLVIDDVLLVADEDKIIIGKPFVGGARVTAKILEQKKGKKIRVMKYKSKVRYRRAMGFRPLLSVVKIDEISFGASKKKEVSKTAP